MTDVHRTKILEHLNTKRSEFAKKHNVANMHRVVSRPRPKIPYVPMNNNWGLQNWDGELEFLSWAYISLTDKERCERSRANGTKEVFFQQYPCMRSRKFLSSSNRHPFLFTYLLFCRSLLHSNVRDVEEL